jgi:hypothetical protein
LKLAMNDDDGAEDGKKFSRFMAKN